MNGRNTVECATHNGGLWTQSGISHRTQYAIMGANLLSVLRGRHTGSSLRVVRINPKTVAGFSVSSTEIPFHLGICAKALRGWGILHSQVTRTLGGSGLRGGGIFPVYRIGSHQGRGGAGRVRLIRACPPGRGKRHMASSCSDEKKVSSKRERGRTFIIRRLVQRDITFEGARFITRVATKPFRSRRTSSIAFNFGSRSFQIFPTGWASTCPRPKGK